MRCGLRGSHASCAQRTGPCSEGHVRTGLSGAVPTTSTITRTSLRDAISRNIGGDGSYQGRARRNDAVGGMSEFTIAWKNVAAAALYQRNG